ncbi:CinA family protein [Mycoplasmoides pirum]|uniref:CinA family protein n=1 Tax=Mycoplasmoides pirum TaxID=2122 RepID=UPI00048493AC|nr:CinA family protein [Mycoplasmoides pirum]
MKDYKDFIIDKLIKNKYTLSTAESVTGGMIASTLVGAPNASSVYKGGVITYTSEMKKKLLNVKDATIREHGVISSEVAKEMAIGAIKNFNSDISISVTGIAGPTNTENKPVGLYYFCIVIIDRAYEYEGRIEKSEVDKWLATSGESEHEINDSVVRSVYRKLMTMKIVEQLFKLLIKQND